MLGYPGSQIECERVFSLAYLLVAAPRNRMSSDRLASTVFASKNIDMDKALHDLLGSYYESDLNAGAQL